jgi:hypothetical protein
MSLRNAALPICHYLVYGKMRATHHLELCRSYLIILKFINEKMPPLGSEGTGNKDLLTSGQYSY